MNNIKNIIEWIDQYQNEMTLQSLQNPPSIDDLLEILNMTSLVWDKDDDDPIPSQCPDRSSYEPYLRSSQEAAVIFYLFSIYDSAGKSIQEKISLELKKRLGRDTPLFIIEIIVAFHNISLSTELVREYASGEYFSKTLAEMMLDKKVNKKEWVDILSNAPNRFLPEDPVESAAYPWLKESREKESIHLENLLDKLKNISL